MRWWIAIMITLKAHFDGKVIVPDEPVELPEGELLVVRVTVPRRKPKGKRREGKSALKWLAEHAVKSDNLPTDLAHQHDHYLYGTPKKPEAKP
jgi:hypothetical protein